jgi:hypothetical protein
MKKISQLNANSDLTLLSVSIKWRLFAGIAQLVEHNLAKVGVASSNLVSRSKLEASTVSGFFLVIFTF